MGESILGNRYEIIRKIGEGGMAFVYEAKDNLLNRTVAVKVLRPEFADDEEFVEKFKREAEAVASLSHANIVNVYDVGKENKINYIVMEFVDGRNLKEIIKEEGILDEYTALEITKQIAQALGEAHRKGIIHRDIKPHNILISNEGRSVKVTDFGIAKAVTNTTMTNIGNIIGSVHYFSPEQAKGKFISNNADLYSLGIVLYEMLVGRVPFRGDSPVSIAIQHINDEIEFTAEEEARIPLSVRTIIKKLTQKSSTDRYQEAEELIEDIEYVEKNIDTNLIKEYDNYSTTKISRDDINSINIIPDLPVEQENTEEFAIEEDEYKDINAEEEKNIKSRKTKKRLTIAAIILIIILIAQILFIGKMFFGDRFESNTKSEAIIVPNFTGLTLDEAEAQINELGLDIAVSKEYSDEIEEDKVISHMPIAGSSISQGDTIDLTISLGEEKNEMPNLVGINLSEAQRMIEENNLVLGNVTEQHSNIYKEGVVMKQSLKPKENIEEGLVIDLVVSIGKEEQTTLVPSVVGHDIQEAQKILESRGFKLGNIQYENSEQYGANVVMKQTPPAGYETDAGLAIDILVSKGPEPVAPEPTPEPQPEPAPNPNPNPDLDDDDDDDDDDLEVPEVSNPDIEDDGDDEITPQNEGIYEDE